MKIHTSSESRENKGKRKKPLLLQKRICMSQHKQEIGENVSPRAGQHSGILSDPGDAMLHPILGAPICVPLLLGQQAPFL